MAMAASKFNSKSPTIKRILKEASELATSPSPDYYATPASDSDLFDWHFTIRGPPSTPYSNGIYHGRIVLPPTYPLRPPSFRFLTPSGRFEVNREICLSISGHHEETWQPAWGIRTALVALRAFMESDAKGQLGGLECSARERERFASLSGGWRCSSCGSTNLEILKEREEKCNEMNGGEGKKGEEVEIPKELKLAYKDELGKEGGKAENEKEETELAEGFFPAGNSEGLASAEYPPAAPTQSVPQPTGASPASNIPSQSGLRAQQAPATTAPARIANAYPHQQQQQQVLLQRVSNEGVPAWIDRSIAGVVVCLIVMVLKVLLGL